MCGFDSWHGDGVVQEENSFAAPETIFSVRMYRGVRTSPESLVRGERGRSAEVRQSRASRYV